MALVNNQYNSIWVVGVIMKKSTKILLGVCSVVLILIVLFCLLQAKRAPTWQEQYELGLYYLSEGNYQEAIIAFTAAIEIDAMRPEAYLKAAEAYEAAGDIEAAREILEKGYATTGDESLFPREMANTEDESLNQQEDINDAIGDMTSYMITEDFIVPEELLTGGVPFYTTDIYSVEPVYTTRLYSGLHTPPHTDSFGNLMYNAEYDGGSGYPQFIQEADASVLRNVTYRFSENTGNYYQPEFRNLIMGMPVMDALTNLGFSVEFINQIEDAIDYEEIPSEIQEVDIWWRVQDGNELRVAVIWYNYEGTSEEILELILYARDNILQGIEMRQSDFITF